jgi:hypothetical protein
MMNNKTVRFLFGLAALTAITPVGAAVPHRANVAPSLPRTDAKKVTVTLMRWPYT